MKARLLTAVLSATLLTLTAAFSQKITTVRPYVQEQSQRYVTLSKVELTDDYTILYFTYRNDTRSQRFSLEDLLGGQTNGSGQIIQIDPKCRLYEPNNVNHKFRFIKADGIPLSPDKRSVRRGDVVNFVVYFERLEPGIEVFDMYEGKDYDSMQFWNFYGVHIRNPKRQLPPKPRPVESTPPPVVAEKPVEPTAPVVAEPPAPTAALAVVRGNILNAKTKQPVAAKLSYTVRNDEGGVDSLQLSASSGKFKLNLPPLQSYDYSVSARGYLPTSGTFDLSKTTAGQPTNVEILLTPVAVGSAMTLSHVYFAVSKFDLLPTSYAELDLLVNFMQENPNAEVRVEGHTDNLGDFDENVKLSLNRANAVKQYLVSKGIASARIETKGYGPTRPVTKGTSEAERRRNRRVEFVLSKV